MKLKITFLILIITCISIRVNAQASINNNAVFTYHYPVPIVSNVSIGVPGPFTMDNFKDKEEYKIQVHKPGDQIVNNINMSVGDTIIGDNVQFTWHTYEKFRVTYFIPVGTPIGLHQQLNFIIYRKRFGLWDWQTTFVYHVYSSCPKNWTISPSLFPLSGIDYEVSDHLTVERSAYPNGGLTELDGGQSVTLLPGFSTDLTGGGAVQAIIDGCGGAYRIANLNTPINNSEDKLDTETFNEDLKIYPNPIQDYLNIHTPASKLKEVVKIEIKDLSGKVLFYEEKILELNTKINLENLKSGLYLINIVGDKFNQSQKIVKS